MPPVYICHVNVSTYKIQPPQKIHSAITYWQTWISSSARTNQICQMKSLVMLAPQYFFVFKDYDVSGSFSEIELADGRKSLPYFPKLELRPIYANITLDLTEVLFISRRQIYCRWGIPN